MAFQPVAPQFTDGEPREGIIRAHVGHFDGYTLKVTYEVGAEHHARQRAAVGAITDERLLAALFSLPDDDLVPVDPSLDASFDEPGMRDLVVILEDPEGLWWGQRCRTPPVKILEIQARVRSWERGREVAHDWVGYGPRVVHLERQSDDLDFLLIEAAHFGIGIRSGPEERTVLEAGPFAQRRWTVAQWRFAELVYAQFLVIEGQVRA